MGVSVEGAFLLTILMSLCNEDHFIARYLLLATICEKERQEGVTAGQQGRRRGKERAKDAPDCSLVASTDEPLADLRLVGLERSPRDTPNLCPLSERSYAAALLATLASQSRIPHLDRLVGRPRQERVRIRHRGGEIENPGRVAVQRGDTRLLARQTGC